MKGIVFNLNGSKKAIRIPDIKKRGLDIKRLFSRFGLQTMFALLFLLGLIVGAASSKSFDKDTFDKLDLLFVTNIDARLEMSVFDIFASCFVSYFLYILCAFLTGFSVWGFTAIPVLAAVKGFTVGLSSAFIFSLYRLSGIGFYILVVLPGTVLFLFILVRYSSFAFRMSMRYMKLSALGLDREPELRIHIKKFLKKTLLAFLSSGVCAVIDMILWLLFAGKFEF